MPEKTSIERFLGDQVRRLQLTKSMIDELERTTGMGILALYSGVLHRTARHRDLTEIVRCALIGGGTAPQEADTLVRIYIDGAPILPTLALVLEILDAAFEGVEPAAEAPAPQAHFFPVEDEETTERVTAKVKSAVAKATLAAATDTVMVAQEIAAANAVLRDAAGIDRRDTGPVHLDLDEVA